MKSLINSFKYAFLGINYAIKFERNFRIHLIMIFYVTVFSNIVKLQTWEYISLIFCFAGVISMELINTAIELVCDKDGRDFNQYIKYAKDVSASAVLVYAIASIGVGIIIFFPRIPNILTNLNIYISTILSISIPFSLIFVFKGEKK